jgi:hypothetical protein
VPDPFPGFHPGYGINGDWLGSVDDAFFIHHGDWWMGESSSTLREGREQLGGAYSLFLRGMPSAGVYFSRPADGLLDASDNLFAEGK